MNHKQSDMPIIIAGYPGAGKTTVGAMLAEQLGCSFADGDQGIILRSGMSIEEIFARHGEEGFRDWERRFYLETPLTPGMVLSVGGGSMLDAAVRTRFESECHIVCLHVSCAEAIRRLASGYTRPLLSGGQKQERYEQLWRERAHHYASFPLVVDTTRLSPQNVVAEIIIRLGLSKK